MAISFRQADPGNPRSMFPWQVDELEQLARIHGTFIERVETVDEERKRFVLASGHQRRRFEY